MVECIDSDERLKRAAVSFCDAKSCLALTGAGISVDCGIPDFRSRGGLWSRFDPDEYATFSAFLDDPEKVWRMYRELGRTISGKKPGRAHRALAQLEEAASTSSTSRKPKSRLCATAASPGELRKPFQHL